MASVNVYRSPRNPKRFRVLAESKPAGKFFVCEGLADPVRRAHWRLLFACEHYGTAAHAFTQPHLGRAIIPGDCVEVDFVNSAGEVLK